MNEAMKRNLSVDEKIRLGMYSDDVLEDIKEMQMAVNYAESAQDDAESEAEIHSGHADSMQYEAEELLGSMVELLNNIKEEGLTKFDGDIDEIIHDAKRSDFSI